MAFLYEFFGKVLAWFNSWTGSYAIAILLFAIAFKIVFLPFAIKQQQNQIKMAKLRPKIAKIEKKYAGRNDQPTLQKKQQEIMELQQKEGYSPLSGCLPMLIQLPVIMVLYKVIQNPLSYIARWDDKLVTTVTNIVNTTGATLKGGQIELLNLINGYANRAALEEAGVVFADLPDFSFLGANLAENPSFKPFNILIVIPILAAAFQWLSMWLMKRWNGTAQMPQGDAQSQMSMKMMDLVMPVMTLFFAFNFSGMLGLYWIYQSILGILQSFILAKAMPLPTFTEEELREMEKEERSRAKAQREAIKSQPRVKSLHHIDDEDYDELPELEGSTPSDNKKRPGGIEGGSLKK